MNCSMLYRVARIFLFAIACVASFACARDKSEQVSSTFPPASQGWHPNYVAAEFQAQLANRRQDKEVLLPLTDQERSLDPREIVTQQPDFVADLEFFRSEPRGGYGGAERIARKGNRFRHENEIATLLGEPGKPSISLHKSEKVYDDFLASRNELAAGIEPFDPRTLAAEAGVTFTILGAVVIENQRLLKIRAKRTGKFEKINLFAAPTLKNLIVIAQILNPPFGMRQTLHNVSLDVPADLFEVPADYQPVKRDRWTKIETTAIRIKHGLVKDAGAFRGPKGEIFIWIRQSTDLRWYLVRIGDRTVETPYQYMLVTRSGQTVWDGQETEAFSVAETSEFPRSIAAKQPGMVVGPNSVSFHSNNHDTNHSLIQVRW